MSASISTKKDSTAARESKYSVEATMDVRINAGQEDLPSGLLTMLEVLNSSFSIYDPDGEITIVPQTGVVNIGSNGKATILAKYLNEDGVYAPSELKCNDSNATVDILDKTQVRLTFNKPGVYVITAGTQSATVTVNPVEGTKQLIQDEP
jgi:hypothetical protein